MSTAPRTRPTHADAVMEQALQDAAPNPLPLPMTYMPELTFAQDGQGRALEWTAAGLDAVKIGLLTELFWGMASRSYIRTRAWSD